jgi:hypothetical protein
LAPNQGILPLQTGSGGIDTDQIIGASFRDPSGFVFKRGSEILRQVNQSYREDYQVLFDSGLYHLLVNDGKLISHEEIDAPLADPHLGWKIIRPRKITFISYPYEWCFSQLKDAALLTLAIQKQAMQRGMSLKDASAYNIQFDRGRPILIDTLSFERLDENEPWGAYGQFCRHFLAPLALVALRDARLSQLLLTNLDGIPLELATRLLPRRSLFKFSLLMHLHIHARMEKRHGSTTTRPATSKKMNATSLLGIIDSLESAIRSLKWDPGRSQWSDYYDQTTYTQTAMDRKTQIVSEAIETVRPATVWDLGANIGKFCRLASDRGIFILALDNDPAAVETNYLQSRSQGDAPLLPLVMDLTNPSPAVGWANREHTSLIDRGPADLVLALALVHHLAISGNVPLDRIAQLFASLGRNLLVEFVPKSDPQISRLLVVRRDIFADYDQQNFESQFARFFAIRQRYPIPDSGRIIYLMTRSEEA